MTDRAQRLPRDPEFEARVRASFERQRFMKLIGARLSTIEPGVVEIEAPGGARRHVAGGRPLEP